MSECICSAGSKSGEYDHSDYCPIGKDQRIAELEAELAVSARRIETEMKIGNSYLEELATIKEKARAAVNAPYEDILDMRQALRELGEAIPE